MGKKAIQRPRRAAPPPSRYVSMADEGQLERDEIIGIDGRVIGPWPAEYDRALTLRLLNGDIRHYMERVAYVVFRDKYPALLEERHRRAEIMRAAKAARKH